jgi:peroxiredoxin
MIQVGDALPEATLFESTEIGEACPVSPAKLSSVELARGKKVVLFALPGAFTPTCSAQHVPGYAEHLDALRAKGVNEVWCVSVNDGFVMAAWGAQLGVLGKIRMLGDGAAELTQKLGLSVQIPGMGVRSKRFSMLIVNGTVRRLNVEAAGKFDVSDAETLLGQID